MKNDRLIDAMSKAVTFETVSHSNIEEFDLDKFQNFLDFLKETYPLVFKKLFKTFINEYAPVFHWQTDSKEKPLLLTAHYDVVPAKEEDWLHPPFSGKIIDNKICGRGTIDDKNSIISIMETLQTLLEEDFSPQRDIYVAFGFDEECKSEYGARNIASYFENLGLKFHMVLDEGGIVTQGSMLGIEKDIAVIGIAEKGSCNFEITFNGEGGHSSAPPKETAISNMASFIKATEKNPPPLRMTKSVSAMLKVVGSEKKGISSFFMKHPDFFAPILKKVMGQNKQTLAMLHSNVTFTMCNGGLSPNSLPTEVKLIANARLLQGETSKDIEIWLKSFGYASDINAFEVCEATKISPIDSQQYRSLEETISQVFGSLVVTTPYLMIGGTDAKEYNNLSDYIYRFMPCVLTSDELDLMHNAGEYISIENLEKMVIFYKTLIMNICTN